MIRSTTPLPRRPRAEAELLNEMLRLLSRCPPMWSGDIVNIVKKNARVNRKLNGIDIRMMLCPPYFRLEDQGWRCLWNLPVKAERQ